MKGQPPQEWRAPGKKQIEKACANSRQVVLALAGGEIIFFELDEAMQNIQAGGFLFGRFERDSLCVPSRMCRTSFACRDYQLTCVIPIAKCAVFQVGFCPDLSSYALAQMRSLDASVDCIALAPLVLNRK